MASSSAADSSSTSHPATTVALPSGAAVSVVAASGLSDADLRQAVGSTLFKDWLKKLHNEAGILTYGNLKLKQVLIQGVDMFGSRVGFVKFRADIVDDETRAKIPGIVFARGPAVAVLLLLHCGEECYAVLTEQPRVPVGRCILELPAGMIDDEEGDFLGTAVREVEEETGLKLKLDDMINLTDTLRPETGRCVFPSPGGCDEEIRLFFYRGQVDEATLNSLRGRETGLRSHGELIKVHVVPYNELWRSTADAKALCAVALYEMATREGLLPAWNSH